jgi:hypothetical protein
MELIAETRIPDLAGIAFEDMGRYEEARLVAAILDEPCVPVARFQSSF